MTTPLILFGAVALFLLLIILLLSLNIFSLWRWYIKAGMIVVSLCCVGVFYYVVDNLIGWPSPDAMPRRFNLLYTRVVEPDKIHGTDGHVYLWIEQIDEHQIIISAPRAFEVPYTASTASKVADAQKQLDGGSKILGEYDEQQQDEAAKQEEADPTSKSSNKKGQATKDDSDPGRGEGFENVGEPALSFSDMPSVDLPDKSGPGDVTITGGQ